MVELKEIDDILKLGLQVKIRPAGGDNSAFRVDIRREGKEPDFFAYHDDWRVALGECWRQATGENPSLVARIAEHQRIYDEALKTFRQAMIKLEADFGEYAVEKARGPR